MAQNTPDADSRGDAHLGRDASRVNSTFPPSVGENGRARKGKEGVVLRTERDRPIGRGWEARQKVGTVGDGLTGVPAATPVNLLFATVATVSRRVGQRPVRGGERRSLHRSSCGR